MTRRTSTQAHDPAPPEVEAYLAAVPEVAQTTLRALRQSLLALMPTDAVECLSYGVPAFRSSQSIAGYAAAKSHCRYYPMSGCVITRLAADLAGYEVTKGAIHFPLDTPLSAELVGKLVTARLAEMPMKKKKAGKP